MTSTRYELAPNLALKLEGGSIADDNHFGLACAVCMGAVGRQRHLRVHSAYGFGVLTLLVMNER